MVRNSVCNHSYDMLEIRMQCAHFQTLGLLVVMHHCVSLPGQIWVRNFNCFMERAWSALECSFNSGQTIGRLKFDMQYFSNRCLATDVSTALKGSSRRQISALRYTALARVTLAFCPPLRVTPLSPTRVRSPSTNNSISYPYDRNNSSTSVNTDEHTDLTDVVWGSLRFALSKLRNAMISGTLLYIAACSKQYVQLMLIACCSCSTKYTKPDIYTFIYRCQVVAKFIEML